VSHPYENAAIRIVDWLHHAERDLIGSPVSTFNGDAGVVRELKLDEHHGLCFTLDEKPGHVFREGLPPARWYPVSTIKFKGPKP
jgi:hypothetical protein